jgi:hypothetical protein
VGNRTRANQRDWFLQHIDKFFSFIFPEKLDHDRDEDYLRRVKALAVHFLDKSNPRFIYPSDENVSFIFII